MRNPPDDHVGKAIAWLMLGVAAGLFLDLCAKEILRTYSLQQFVFMRSIIVIALLLIVAPLLVSIGLLDDGRWITPDAAGWILFAGAGLGSVLAWIGLVNAYRGAPPALPAPLEYTAPPTSDPSGTKGPRKTR